MNTNFLKLTILTVAPTTLLLLASCSSKKASPGGVESSVTVATEEGVPGGVVVETYHLTAKVTAINSSNRKVTLKTEDGTETTYKVGPDAINFDQVHVGDQVDLTVAQEVVVTLADADSTSADKQGAMVALAPKGSKPAGIVAATDQVTATVTAIDVPGHKATLKFPDGTTKTVAVRPDIDLTKRKVGEQVLIQVTEALALSVEKPQPDAK
jgi:hypothetical protein